MDKFTGDGLMAVFGARAALEDHALRACLAALGVQDEIARLATEVDRSDGVALRLRIGLNSGQVIAGEMSSGPGGYTAIGDQVGFAQRMESVAPPGGVMLSESTARLVEHAVVLGEPERVRIKGADEAVPARRLLAAATTVLVEALLERGDLDEAQAAIDRLASVPTERGFVLHELPLLRLRALVARARGDDVGYGESMQRYRAMAVAAGFAPLVDAVDVTG